VTGLARFKCFQRGLSVIFTQKEFWDRSIMRTRVLADGPKPKKTHTKYDENIGRHLKKKKIGTPKVFQRLCFSPLRSKKSQP
jgi:hypothetical protein